MNRILRNRETGAVRPSTARASARRIRRIGTEANRVEATQIALAAMRNMNDNQKRNWTNMVSRYYRFPNFVKDRWAAKTLRYLRGIRNGGGADPILWTITREYANQYANGTINWKNAMNTIIEQVRYHSMLNEPNSNNNNYNPNNFPPTNRLQRRAEIQRINRYRRRNWINSGRNSNSNSNSNS